ncbi:hypothetical protein [Mucilaginibacter sp. UYNi724]
MKSNENVLVNSFIGGNVLFHKIRIIATSVQMLNDNPNTLHLFSVGRQL